jgi:hypothetical protein
MGVFGPSAHHAGGVEASPAGTGSLRASGVTGGGVSRGLRVQLPVFLSFVGGAG